MVEYRELSGAEIGLSLFAHFQRTQQVTKCWRKINQEWCIKDCPFIDDWSVPQYQELADYLYGVSQSGGFVMGAFQDGQMKGFASVEPALFGKRSQYMDLSNIHVSQDVRGCGMGTGLFAAAKKWAKDHGAEKLYISAHSAVESQAFYRAMGCVEAAEYNQALVEKEPYDCQLECAL